MKFKAKVIRVSTSSYGFIIPKAFVTNDFVKLGSIYELDMEEYDGKDSS